MLSESAASQRAPPHCPQRPYLRRSSLRRRAPWRGSQIGRDRSSAPNSKPPARPSSSRPLEVSQASRPQRRRRTQGPWRYEFSAQRRRIVLNRITRRTIGLTCAEPGDGLSRSADCRYGSGRTLPRCEGGQRGASTGSQTASQVGFAPSSGNLRERKLSRAECWPMPSDRITLVASAPK